MNQPKKRNNQQIIVRQLKKEKGSANDVVYKVERTKPNKPTNVLPTPGETLNKLSSLFVPTIDRGVIEMVLEETNWNERVALEKLEDMAFQDEEKLQEELQSSVDRLSLRSSTSSFDNDGKSLKMKIWNCFLILF